MNKCEIVRQELIAVQQAAWWHLRLRRIVKAAPLVVLFLLLNSRSAHALCSSNPAPDPAVDGSSNSLRAAIQTANASGQDCVIRLHAGTYTLTIKNTAGQENAAAQGDLDITDSGHTVTIQGQGSGVSIVNGGGVNGIDDRVFQVLGGANATFRGLTIEGGVANDNGVAGTQPGATESDGGGILVQDGGHVNLSNVVLSGNQAVGGTGANGAITGYHEVPSDASCGHPTLIGSPGAPGGLAAGGGLFISAGTVNLRNSKISGNAAAGGAGGQGGVEYCTSGSGIGDFVFGAAGLGGNGAGGALYVLSGIATLSRSTVSGNSATGGVGGAPGNLDAKDNISFLGPAAVGGAAQGAGLYVHQGALHVGQTTISGNAALAGTGGGDPTCKTAPGFASLCEYSSRSAEKGGGASGAGLFILGGHVTVADSTLFANKAQGGPGGFIPEFVGGSNSLPPPLQGAGGDAAGGGLYANGGSLSLTGVTLGSNQALATSVEPAPAGSSSGGGIANVGATSLVLDTTLVGNNTQDSGNASNGDDILGAVTSSYSLIGQTTGATITDNGNNVFDADPLLDPLGLRWNGGPTQTVALQTGSPAIDAGDNAACAAPQPAGLGGFDQRGYARFPHGDSRCDIGAFEFYDLLVYPQGGQFGPLPVGQPSPSRSFTITNNQTASVSLSTSLSGANPGDFVENSTCGTTLAANASCTIKVVFKPTAIGTRSAVLLASDSPDRTSPFTVKLTGAGK